MLNFYKVFYHFFTIDKVYSFNIFLYDLQREKRIISLYANSPVTSELIEEWKKLEEIGAYIQIYHEDKHEFFIETGLVENDLIEANKFYFDMLDLQNFRINNYEKLASETFLLRTVLNEISKTNDFLPLIKRVHAEVMCFPLYKSELVSIATELVDVLFVRDILPVRIASLAYMLAKQNKITDIEILSTILISSLTKDLGYGLIRTSLFSKFNELNKTDIFYKHPMLSIYILSKSGHDFDKKVKRLILEHHEQSDGSGFPREKKEDYIDYISFIINLSDQIIYYSEGLINGRKTELIKTINLFYKQVPSEGINVSFPKRLIDSLGTFMLNELEKDL